VATLQICLILMSLLFKTFVNLVLISQVLISSNNQTDDEDQVI
jgi:hypothetical protein